MKEFFRSLFASLLALAVFVGGGGLLVILLLAAMAPSGPSVPKRAILVFDLATNIPDSTQEGGPGEALQKVMAGGEDGTPLLTLIHALDRAATDKDVAGLYLTGNLRPAGVGSGYAALTELKAAIQRFKASGKPVLAYNMGWSKREFFLCSGAGTIYCNPMGEVELMAPQAQMMFYAGLFKKYGVEMQITRVGKFKSAVEPFILDKMSPENRQQYEQLLGDLWADWKSSVASDRKLKAEQLQAIADQKGLLTASEAKEAGLVDQVAYADQVLDELKRLAGRTDKDREFPQMDLTDYAKLPGESPKGGRIAVVYAEGTIVDGEGDGSQVGGERLSRELRALRLDPGVKAIVLRVNSPGGSATASDLIQREVIAAKQVKPVVISMGSLAASGGYWISTYGSRIFAEPSTITGSIGVFGMLPNVQKLAQEHGITFDGVQLGKLGMPSLLKPATPEELARIQGFVDEIYGQFIWKVSEGRGLNPATVQEIAQGRVWSGKEAKKLGLVDEMGGLQDAIRHAAKLAKLDAYRVDAPEGPRNPVEKLMRILGSGEKRKLVKAGLGDQIKMGLEQQVRQLNSLNDPKGVYALMPDMIEVR